MSTPGSFLVGSFLIAGPHEILAKPMKSLDIWKIAYVSLGFYRLSAYYSRNPYDNGGGSRDLARARTRY